MKDELEFAKQQGLRIKYVRAEDAPDDFKPVWVPLDFATGVPGLDVYAEPDLEQSFKKIFVCSPLRPNLREGTVDPLEVIQHNIRLAQWLCHQLIRSKSESDKMLAVFAPHAFYPYFTEYNENIGLQWLESALDILKLCDAIYVYTTDGLENEADISDGMRECIKLARQLGLEVKFRKITPPASQWKPAPWEPAIQRHHAAG